MTAFGKLTAAAILTFGLAGGAWAQEMTLEGAKVLITTLPGIENCQAPEETPVIPDGKTATEAELTAAIEAFKAFMAASEAYRNCLDGTAQALGDSMTEQLNQAVTMVYNANADEVESLGAKVNEQIRAYNAVHAE